MLFSTTHKKIFVRINTILPQLEMIAASEEQDILSD